jgi:sRNA-binding protein
VAGARKSRGPRRRGKHRKTKNQRTREQKKIGAGAGATGIEPETVIQRDRQRHQTPPKSASAAILIIKISALNISNSVSIYRSIFSLK